MKIVAFVPADRDEICFGLLEGERIEVIEDPFATGEVIRTGECVKRQDVVLVNPCFPSKALQRPCKGVRPTRPRESCGIHEALLRPHRP